MSAEAIIIQAVLSMYSPTYTIKGWHTFALDVAYLAISTCNYKHVDVFPGALARAGHRHPQCRIILRVPGCFLDSGALEQRRVPSRDKCLFRVGQPICIMEYWHAVTGVAVCEYVELQKYHVAIPICRLAHIEVLNA